MRYFLLAALLAIAMPSWAQPRPGALTMPGGIKSPAANVGAGYVTPQMFSSEPVCVGPGHDDTQAIQAAVSAAELTAGIAKVYIPGTLSGYCRITKPITVTRAVSIIGANLGQTAIQAVGFPAGLSIFNVDGTVNPNLESVQIENLTLISDNGRANCVTLNRVSNSVLRNLKVRNCAKNLLLTGNRGFGLVVDNLMDDGGRNGIGIAFERFTGGGNLKIVKSALSGARGIVIDAASIVSDLDLDTPSFENNAVHCMEVRGRVDALSIRSIHVEGTPTAPCIQFVTGSRAKSFSLIGGNMAQSNRHAMDFSGVMEGFIVMGVHAANLETALVRLNGNGDYGLISNNILDTTAGIASGVRPGVAILNNKNIAGPVGPQFNPPLETPDYAVINPAPARALDPNTANVRDVAKVLATLIQDLTRAGLLR